MQHNLISERLPALRGTVMRAGVDLPLSVWAYLPQASGRTITRAGVHVTGLNME